MKRDPDLLRLIMLEAEKVPAGEHIIGSQIVVPNENPQVLAQHMKLLIDQGYLEGSAVSGLAPPSPEMTVITGISWRGHEFIDSIRSDTVWTKTKERVAKAGGSVSIGTLIEVAAAIAKAALHLS